MRSWLDPERMRDDDDDRIGMRQWLSACTAFMEKANPFGALGAASAAAISRAGRWLPCDSIAYKLDHMIVVMHDDNCDKDGSREQESE